MCASYLRKLGLALSMIMLPAVCLLPGAAVAAPAATTDITVKVNGQATTFDVKPLIENGRTLIPLRGVFEKLGAKVDWLAATREATVTSGGHIVKVRLGSNTAAVDGKTVTMDVAAKAVSGRTLVPLRFLSEGIGARVIWVASTRTVEILDLNKLTPEQQQLLAAFDNIKNAHRADLKMEYSMKANGTGAQSFDANMNMTSKVVINNDDSHMWMNIEFSGGDASELPPEPLTMEVIKKGGQLYAKSGADPWQAVDQSQLDIPLSIAGDSDEQFLRYYNLPFKVQPNMAMDGQQTTQYSFNLDPKTFTDMLHSAPPLSGTAGKDQDLLNIFKGMSVGSASKSLYLDTTNRIIQDNASMSMTLQPPASSQPADQGVTGLVTTFDIESTYDYSGQPETITAPSGVFPGA